MTSVASLVALLVAAALNFAGGRLLGENYPVYGAPVVEEAAKTISAIALGAPLMPVHLLFGVAEVFWDVGAGGKILISLSSLLLHMVVGFVTFWIWYFSGLWWVGLAAGIIVHYRWNNLVFRRQP